MGQHNGITPPARPLVSFTPMNMQEHENDIRAIINTHMGMGEGNPSAWVIKAGLECFSRGFGEGWAACQKASANNLFVSPQVREIADARAAWGGETPGVQDALDAKAPPLTFRRYNPRVRDATPEETAAFEVQHNPAVTLDSAEELHRLLREQARQHAQAASRNADRQQWLAFFTATLTGAASSAGDSDNVVTFARQIADTAMEAWRGR